MESRKYKTPNFIVITFYFLLSTFYLGGCARLFGWDIHAPGLLSKTYYERVQTMPVRLALYIPENLDRYVSTDRGGKLADPQTYHVGEALAPILIEAFQQGFEEFILLEAEPTEAILKRYEIPHLVTVNVTGFYNDVTMKGQAIQIQTVAEILDSDLKPVARFQNSGTSDAKRIFSKKGGPEINLNSALENNTTALVQSIQDFLKQKTAS